jgi:pSer/pThr/pTyr-binding forkhead associated (FHA) protein
MAQLIGWLNDARIRSAVAGGLGGFLGWFAAELFVGRPAGLWTAAVAGLLCGVGIAGTLGAAEGIIIRSWSLTRRGLLVGIALGAVGGMIGAAFGQLTYSVTSSGSDQGTIFAPNFSTDVQKRVEGRHGETGEIEVALIWDNTNDLDLHVVDPAGEEIYYQRPRSRSGGWLDIDCNAGCHNTTNTPIEHVRWRQGSAPDGIYTVSVVFYANCEASGPTKYRIEVKTGNEPVRKYEGAITYTNSEDRVRVCEFKWPPPPVLPASAGPGLFGILAIIIGWGIFGALVGVAEGNAKRSSMAIRNAGIGGTIGGTIGGIALVAILSLLAAGSNQATHGSLVAHSGWFGRLIGFIILGACIGLWIVLIERALSAILSVRSGRNEGREIYLDKQELRLGRNDALEVYLGGDNAIAPHHATIIVEQGRHVILAAEGQVFVNGTTVARQRLSDGDNVALGNTRLVYRHRTATPTNEDKGAIVTQSAAPPPPPPPKKMSPAVAVASNVGRPPAPQVSPAQAAPGGPSASPASPRSNSPPPPPPPPPRKRG